MTKYLLCAALLLMVVEPVARCEPRCAATPLSQPEAKSLVMSVPEAVAAKKLRGKLSAVVWRPAHRRSSFYYFMLISTVSTPTTPLNNGVLGYFSVDKDTGQVVNVAGEVVVGKELERLQSKLRLRHCITRALVVKGQGVKPYPHSRRLSSRWSRRRQVGIGLSYQLPE